MQIALDEGSRWKTQKEEDEDEKYLNGHDEDSIQQQAQNQQNDQEEDPLDAFMNTLQQPKPSQKPIQQNPLQEEDYQLQFNMNEQFISDGSHQDSNHSKEQTQKDVPTLQPIDFTKQCSRAFKKNLYKEHEQIGNLTPETVRDVLRDFEVKIEGRNPPRPVLSFAHLHLNERLNRIIADQDFERPTPVQCIALPAALSGRNIVAVAETGSGKTLAYILPMLVHAQERQTKGSPTALVLAPTRELCQQIYIEARKYSKKSGLKVVCLLGGQNKHEQWKELKKGVDILVCSPGRLIEMLKKKATNLLQVSYFVLDQADRMLSLGFQQQIRSISSQIPPDRQCMLFTATMKQQMKHLIEDIVSDVLFIGIGEMNAVNQNVQQSFTRVQDNEEKLRWLCKHLPQLRKEGKVLIFANQRQSCEEICVQLKTWCECTMIHGNMNQYERTVSMNAFKAGCDVMVGTDVAARGIDVKNIQHVINMDCPSSAEMYVHRVGRAGRAGLTGTAHTLLTASDTRFATTLLRTNQMAGQPTDSVLEEVAMLDSTFRTKRLSAKMGVSFAKGKDAGRLLQNALKRQNRDRSGLGSGADTLANQTVKYIRPFDQEFRKKLNSAELTLEEVANMVRDKLTNSVVEEKYGKFIKSEDQKEEEIKESTIHLYQKKRK